MVGKAKSDNCKKAWPSIIQFFLKELQSQSINSVQREQAGSIDSFKEESAYTVQYHISYTQIKNTVAN